MIRRLLIPAVAAWLLVSMHAIVPSAWLTTARADDSSIGATGGVAYAVRATDIRLAAETVQAVCFGGFAEYRVDFRFVNEGPRRTVTLGFPFRDMVGEGGTERPVGFQAWRDGRPLTVIEMPARGGDGRNGYMAHKAIFPRGVTMITVTYLARPSASATGRSRDSNGDISQGYAASYEYWLHTGASWAGPIGCAVVRYRFADSFRGREIGMAAKAAGSGIAVTSPRSWTRPLPRTYQWRFTDFEPRVAPGAEPWQVQSPYDIVVGFSQPTTTGDFGDRGWTWSSIAHGPYESFGGTSSGNLQDGDLSTCWAEGVPGPGIGEWVEKRFTRMRHLRELRLVTGDNEMSGAFAALGRPRTLRAVFSDGSSQLLKLQDAPTLQRFPVHVTTKSVRFVIESVYPGSLFSGTCISEVEFGGTRAPGYAPFARLIVDPRAVGDLPAGAGPAAPAPPPGAATRQQLADDFAAGDLIGISDTGAFPADEAPFKEPSSVKAMLAREPEVALPDTAAMGDPTAVSALSATTFELRYASGIDLLVNTDVSGRRSWPVRALAGDLGSYRFADDRGLPYDVVAVGDRALGVVHRGEIDDGCCGLLKVPTQVFWRFRNMTYHLYARSDSVTTERLVSLARLMIGPEAAVETTARPVTAASVSSWPWWAEALLGMGLAATIVVTIVAAPALSSRRRSRRAPAGPRPASS